MCKARENPVSDDVSVVAPAFIVQHSGTTPARLLNACSTTAGEPSQPRMIKDWCSKILWDSGEYVHLECFAVDRGELWLFTATCDTRGNVFIVN